SQEGSQGFFTFSMDQQPDLPVGSLIQNTASIIFDFNPPILTNTVFHTIGKLSVSIDHPQPQAGLWQLMGNPMGDHAMFWSTVAIPGAKRFELYDLMGRAIRQEVFYGDEYIFRRGMIHGGMYVFRLIDGEGRQFTGKIVLAE
ncbi:MAG: T9SS type A sorting domain-containing protein, partial [Saprospiraceae bacterium]|nr:T9SS type A sorting domain-containing protein [Saprospiraceae bacterium]